MTITTLIRPIALTAIPGMPLGWLSGTVILVKDGNVNFKFVRQQPFK